MRFVEYHKPSGSSLALSRTRLLATSTNFARKRRSTSHHHNAISGNNTTTNPSTPSLPLSQHSPTVRHLSSTLLSISSPSHSANMADMDTYDNEPRTSGYDGMPYTYSPYANRRICSYEDLDESNTPSSDPWSRAREGDFNIYPHSRQSWHATPLRPFIY
jgi:hypothetical protein